MVKKKKRLIFIFSSVGGFLVLCVIGALITLNIFYGIFHSGNASKYNVKNTEQLSGSVIEGNTYYFLGSSVTQGFASFNETMADYIAKRNKCTAIKEAVSGTFLANIDNKSYVSRITNFDTKKSPNAFICQLSTNDVRHENKGEMIDRFAIDTFDKTTTYGAIEYIIAYAKDTWDCPVVFYTNSYYENEVYAEMITVLLEIANKWEITVLDLYNDSNFNAISATDRKLYMNDDVHPTRAGYKLWWTPKFEEVLYSI